MFFFKDETQLLFLAVCEIMSASSIRVLFIPKHPANTSAKKRSSGCPEINCGRCDIFFAEVIHKELNIVMGPVKGSNVIFAMNSIECCFLDALDEHCRQKRQNLDF